MWVARMVLSTTPRATYKHCCPQGHLPNRVNTDSLVEEVNDRYFTWCILPQFPAGEQAQVVDLLHLMILDYSKMFERLKQLTPLRAQWISFLATARAGCVFIPLVDLRNFICQVQNTRFFPELPGPQSWQWPPHMKWGWSRSRYIKLQGSFG